MNPLVSIITPCYNGEKVAHRLLDSILAQTYTNIEFIFVNDGSKDKTEEVVRSYQEKFRQSGIKFIYIYQENMGLAGAINAGLKIFSGDYLCWPDSDDYLESTSIEKRMKFLENNLQYGCVTSNANIYNENNLDIPVGKITDRVKHKLDEDHFLLLLTQRSIFCSGCHMIRKTAFLDVNPERNIYPARRGQNWQMLLPIYYKYKRGFIDEPLYNYIIYKNSMSRGDDTLEKALFRCSEHEDILVNVLNSMDMKKNDKKMYFELVKIRYIKKRLLVAYQYKNKQLLEEEYDKLQKSRSANLKDKIIYLCGKNTFLDNIFKPLNKLRKKMLLVTP